MGVVSRSPPSCPLGHRRLSRDRSGANGIPAAVIRIREAETLPRGPVGLGARLGLCDDRSSATWRRCGFTEPLRRKLGHSAKTPRR
jgi:hypothetical protein